MFADLINSGLVITAALLIGAIVDRVWIVMHHR